MTDKIVLIVRIRLKAGQKAPFLQQLTSLVQTMRSEQNFVNSIVHHNIEQPDEIVVYETWLGTRETWLKEEYPRLYRADYEQALSGLVEDRSVDWLTPIDDHERHA